MTETTRTGRYLDLSNRDYHADPALSKTGLARLLDSPAKYFACHIDPQRPSSNDLTPSLALGSLTHTLVLEPHRFPDDYVLPPSEVNRRTKAGRETWAQWEATAQGKTVVTQDMLTQARSMADAVFRHPLAKRIFENGEAEQSFFAVDPHTNQRVKCRPDWLTTIGGQRLIVDLKTAVDASPRAFSKSCANFHYYLSASMTPRVMGLCESEPGPYVFVVIETAYPWLVGCYVLNDEALMKGEADYFKALEIYAKCRQSGVWPGYPAHIAEISLPRWAYYDN